MSEATISNVIWFVKILGCVAVAAFWIHVSLDVWRYVSWHRAEKARRRAMAMHTQYPAVKFPTDPFADRFAAKKSEHRA